jgi:Fe-S-cluster containining protein
MGRQRGFDPQLRALLDELSAIYGRVDQLYAGYGCPSSTECCRFAVTGREPYVTSIERLAVERALAARGGALSPKKRALPLLPARDEAICPLLDQHGRCAVYAARPFGCRTFWCHRATSDRPVSHREMQRLLREVQELAARHVADGDRGRPLRRALELGSRSDGPRR